jgi:hypothetical protein
MAPSPWICKDVSVKVRTQRTEGGGQLRLWLVFESANALMFSVVRATNCCSRCSATQSRISHSHRGVTMETHKTRHVYVLD